MLIIDRARNKFMAHTARSECQSDEIGAVEIEGTTSGPDGRTLMHAKYLDQPRKPAQIAIQRY